LDLILGGMQWRFVIPNCAVHALLQAVHMMHASAVEHPYHPAAAAVAAAAAQRLGAQYRVLII
jgi:hypothetical protein